MVEHFATVFCTAPTYAANTPVLERLLELDPDGLSRRTHEGPLPCAPCLPSSTLPPRHPQAESTDNSATKHGLCSGC